VSDRLDEAAVVGAPSLLERLVVLGTFLTVGATLLMSASLLLYMGIPYGEPGGNPLSKIHPATYIALVTFALNAIRRGNPLTYLGEVAKRFPGIPYYLIIWICLISWVIVVQRTPITGIVDTLLTPCLMFLLIADLTDDEHAFLALLVHVFMTLNASIGIIEVSTGWRLVPSFEALGKEVTYDWRGTALLGHPLGNASLTGAYILVLAFGADWRIPDWLRPILILLQFCAMVAFGGRAATVLVLAGILPALVWRGCRILTGGSFDARAAAVLAVVLPIGIGLILLAVDAGVFDKFAERFADDGGSAQTRVAMMRIMYSFNFSDLLFGPNPDELNTKMSVEGTPIAIESFVIGFFVQYGLGISIIFFAALAIFSYEFWRFGNAGIGTVYVIAYFYLVAAGSASLSTKSTIFMHFISVYMTVEARPSARDRRLR
jgi:hypothetical protein